MIADIIDSATDLYSTLDPKARRDQIELAQAQAQAAQAQAAMTKGSGLPKATWIIIGIAAVVLIVLFIMMKGGN